MHYAACAGIAEPDVQAACELQAQKLFHSKIYVEQESNCEIDPVPDDLLVEHEGYRSLKALSPSKNYYVVIANRDHSKAHGFLIFID